MNAAADEVQALERQAVEAETRLHDVLTALDVPPHRVMFLVAAVSALVKARTRLLMAYAGGRHDGR